MRDSTLNPLGAFAVSAFGALCVVGIGIGVVAMFAELGNTWSHYFLLEQVVATATPFTATLFGAAIVSGVIAAVTT